MCVVVGRQSWAHLMAEWQSLTISVESGEILWPNKRAREEAGKKKKKNLSAYWQGFGIHSLCKRKAFSLGMVGSN